MKKEELKSFIRKIITEDLSKKELENSDTVLNYLYSDIKRVLKRYNRVNLELLSDQDIKIISHAWLEQTIMANYIDDTLLEDIYDNEIMHNLLSKKDAFKK